MTEQKNSIKLMESIFNKAVEGMESGSTFIFISFRLLGKLDKEMSIKMTLRKIAELKGFTLSEFINKRDESSFGGRVIIRFDKKIKRSI